MGGISPPEKRVPLDNLTEFAGLPVVDFPEETTEEEWRRELRQAAGSDGTPADVGSVAWRLRVDGTSWMEPDERARHLTRFLSEVGGERVSAMTLGLWGGREMAEPVDLLVEHADAFPNLRSVFVGDVGWDECELSWICQTDLSPLLEAFPHLEELGVRGAAGAIRTGELSLHVPSHGSLRSLTVESGGLPGSATRGIASSGLPALERLELWLGVEDYGGDTSPGDLAPLLSGEGFPELRYLGVRNAERLDEWIPVLAEAPLLKRLEVLDLSLGILTDEGGRVLVERAAAFSGLRELDLHHHYLSEEMEERVRAAFAENGVEVDLSDRLEPDDEDPDEGPMYYTSASE